MRLLLILMFNAMALVAVAYFLPGIRVDGFGSALIAALVLALVNTLIRPLLVLLTLPITVVTLGLFILVINGFLFLPDADISCPCPCPIISFIAA